MVEGTIAPTGTAGDGGATATATAPGALFHWVDRIASNVWFQALLCLIVHRWLWPRVFGRSQLGIEAYFEPFLAPQIFGSRPLLIIAVVPTLVLLLVRRRIAWKRLDESGRLRWLVFGVATLLAWFWATLPFNLFYGNSFVADRLLILVLWGLILVHPLFVHPFMVMVLVFAMQLHHPLPEAAWVWPDKRLPTDALVLFTSFLLVAGALGRRIRAGLPIVLFLGLTGSYYFHAGLDKLRLGPKLWSWLTDNHLSHLLITSYFHDGWLGFLSQERLLQVLSLARPLDLPLAALTLVIELAGIALGWSLGVGRKILLASVALHGGILMSSGIFFWKWIVFDLLLFAFLLREREGEGPLFASIPRWHRAGLVAAVVFVGGSFFYNTPFAWRDTPFVNRFVITGVTAEGERYRLDGDFFTPYDILLTQSRFNYLTPRPMLVGTFGTTASPELADALDTAAVEDLAELRERHARSSFSEHRIRRFVLFLERFISTANERGGKSFWMNTVSPPNHFQGWRVPEHYDFQAPIELIEVELEELFYDGETIVPLHRETVLELERNPNPPGANPPGAAAPAAPPAP